MGIYTYGKGVQHIYYLGTPIAAVYTRGLKIWPKDIEPIINEILSCFAMGYWLDERPWTDDLSWTD